MRLLMRMWNPVTTSNVVSRSLAIEPFPCPRPRIVVRGQFPTAYYPKPYSLWKESAKRLLSSKEARVEKLTGPLAVAVEFHCTRPKSTSLAAPKPDIDNYVKSIFDAITKAGWWEDDCQVVHLIATKRWAEPGQAGFTRIALEKLNASP